MANPNDTARRNELQTALNTAKASGSPEQITAAQNALDEFNRTHSA